MPDPTTRETDTRTTQRVVGPERLGSALARRRFIAAMQPVVGLRHPNLVRTQAITERGEAVLIVIEAVNGVTLESILAADPVLSVAAVPAILRQVAMALAHAHAAGVVHGALSTSCVFIDVNGDAIVADVGLASALATAGGAPGVADDAAALAYASPEIVRGERPSALADQYAFGALAYELLAGQRPFDGSASKLRHAHVHRNPDPIDAPYSDFPAERSKAVMRMLEKHPADRFASLGDAVRAIAPADDVQDKSYRGPLSWLVREQLTGAMRPRASAPALRPANAQPPVAPIDAPLIVSVVKEMLDAPPRRVPSRASRHVGSRGRALMATAAVAAGVVAWYQLTPSTRARVFSDILFERPLEWYSMTEPSASALAQPAQIAATPVAREARVDAVPPPPAARQPDDRRPRGTTDPIRPRPTTTAHPPAPPKTIASAIRSDSPALRTAERPLNARAPTPDPVVLAPIVVPPLAVSPAAVSQATQFPGSAPQASTPLASAPPVSTQTAKPSASAESSATVHIITAADASAAARTVVDQLRRANVSALGASMVASRIDQAFVDWLGRRPVDLEVGAPSASRVAPTSDGGAQVSYAVPITWTHASGARPTRTAMLVVSVRPSPSGVALSNWSLAQPFVP